MRIKQAFLSASLFLALSLSAAPEVSAIAVRAEDDAPVKAESINAMKASAEGDHYIWNMQINFSGMEDSIAAFSGSTSIYAYSADLTSKIAFTRGDGSRIQVSADQAYAGPRFSTQLYYWSVTDTTARILLQVRLPKADSLSETYKITIQEGARIPTYALAKNGSGGYYTVSEDCSFYPSGAKAFQEIDTRVTSIGHKNATDEHSILVFNLTESDYPADQSFVYAHSPAERRVRYKEYNFADYVLLDGTAISKTEWAVYDRESWFNIFSIASSFACRHYGNQTTNPITEITIKAGCQFPSYSYVVNEGERAAYVVREDTKFVYDATLGSWVEVRDLNPVNVSYTRPWVMVQFDGADYPAEFADGGRAGVSDFSFLTNTEIRQSVSGEPLPVTKQNYVVFSYNMPNSIGIKLEDEKSITSLASVTIPKGTEFPSYSFVKTGSGCKYRVKDDVTFSTNSRGVFVPTYQGEAMGLRSVKATHADEEGQYWLTFDVPEAGYSLGKIPEANRVDETSSTGEIRRSYGTTAGYRGNIEALNFYEKVKAYDGEGAEVSFEFLSESLFLYQGANTFSIRVRSEADLTLVSRFLVPEGTELPLMEKVYHADSHYVALKAERDYSCAKDKNYFIDHDCSHSDEQTPSHDGEHHWFVCDFCGAKMGEEAHTPAGDWVIDPYTHHKECSVCGEACLEGEHVLTEGNDFTCPECGYQVDHFTVTLTRGTIDGQTSKDVTPNSMVTVIADDPEESEEFLGWFDGTTRVSTDVTYTFKAVKNIALEAKFGPKQITVSVVGGTISGASSKTVDYGTEVTVVADAPETGKEFVGWFLNGTKVSADASYTFEATASIELEAHFQLISITITLDGGAFEDGASAMTVDYGTSITAIANQEPGKTFEGWYIGEEKVSDQARYTFVATESVTLKARFQALQCLVSVEGGLLEDGSTSGSFDYGSTVTVYALQKEGYTFLGWYKGETLLSSESTYSFTVTEAVSLEGRYEKIPEPEPEKKGGCGGSILAASSILGASALLTAVVLLLKKRRG